MKLLTTILCFALLPAIRPIVSLPAELQDGGFEPVQDTFRAVCVLRRPWNPPLEIAQDCEEAFVALEDDGHIYGGSPGLFDWDSGNSMARFPASAHTLFIPKRYVRGQCVIALVMMKLYEEHSPHYDFPGISGARLPGPFPTQERVSWLDIQHGAGYVRATCDNACGYALVGRERGVGVAIWKKDNLWDSFTRQNGLAENGTDTALEPLDQTVTS
ncbi:MAG: hypothetical protein Q9214_004364 [Letrouitia sp. 1 TL-2023]